MDTIMILHITLLLVVAVAPSYSENKTTPTGTTTTTVATTATLTEATKPTTVKIVHVTNASEGESPTAKSKRGLGIGSSSFGNRGSFSKRIDPSFSSSLTSFDDSPSGLVSPESVTGFNSGKSNLKESFDIDDDIDIKSNPSFDIDSSIKGGSLLNIEAETGIKDSGSFDVDSPTLSLDGVSFSIDGGTFNLDSPIFEVDGAGLKSGSSFSIDSTGFDIDGPTIKNIANFETDFHSAKRSPSYTPDPVVKSSSPSYSIEPSGPRNSPYKSENHNSDSYNDYKPESYQKQGASSIRSVSSTSPHYDSFSKKNYYPNPAHQGYTTPQSSYTKQYQKPVYSSTPPEAVYSDKSQYSRSHGTPNSQVYNSYVTTPYYENYVTPTSSKGISDRSRSISKHKSPYSNPSEVSSATKIQAVSSYGTPQQNAFKNNLFDGQGFGADYSAFQNLNQNSFPQGGGGSLQFGASQIQTPVYNSQYPGPKNSQQVYAPAHQSEINFSPSTKSFEKLSQNLAYTNNPLEYNNKRATALPVVQLQSVQDFPGFIQALETEPVVLTTGSNINFQNAPNFGLSFDFVKANGNQPFLATTDSYQQPQVLPVQSSSSTPQFPQYKGASIKTLPRNEYKKPAGSYQPLLSQPQLHFNTNGQQISRPEEFAVPRSPERIREDVEIIKNNKKIPIPQNGDSEEEEQDDDDDSDDELDEGYKALEREYGHPSEEDDSSEPQIENRDNGDGSSENYTEEPEFKSNMPPMGPFVFKPYDEKVGRLHEFVRQPEPQNRFSEEANEEDDEDYSPQSYSPTTPPVVSYDQKSPKPYFNYASPKPSITSYEDDEDEEETRKYSKQDDDDDESSSYEDKRPKSYIRQYDKKSDGYKKEPLKTKYAYVKPISDISDSPSEDSTAYPKISKYARVKNYTPKPIYRSSYDSSESTERSVRQGTKRPTKKSYKNVEEHETVAGFKADPRVVHEETFGYKIPKKEVSSKYVKGKEEREKQSSSRKAPTPTSYSRYTKDNDGVERYSNVKKTPTEDLYVHSRRGSFKSNTPKKGDATSYENGDSYSYSSGKNWKGNKKAPETADSHSYPTSEAKNVQYITEDDYSFFSPERIRPGMGESIFRDFIDVY